MEIEEASKEVFNILDKMVEEKADSMMGHAVTELFEREN